MAAKGGKKRRGRFIVFEGIDGSGTTTQARWATEFLLGQGYGVHATREPSDGPIGTLIRQILSGRVVSRPAGAAAEPVDPATIALLFAADRLDHAQGEIAPHLAAGRMVVCDRYVLSSLAYQSVDVDLKFVRSINARAMAPDLTVFLRVRPEVAMDRIERTRTDRDAFETLPFQRQVAERYEKLVDEYRDGQVVVVDGELDKSMVTARVRAAVEEIL